MFEELEIKNKNLVIYHRTTLSKEEKDKSFYKYLQKYGLINPRNEVERNKNYLKSGIYFNSILVDDKNYNKHYGKWILKGSCNIEKFFIVDFLFYKTFFNPKSTQDKYLEEQFDLFGYKFNQNNKIKPIWIYTNQYYKIYRTIENDIDKIRDKINGIIFWKFNYLLDNTDTLFINNKQIDNYQLVVYNTPLININSIKWFSWNKWDKLEFKCKEFIFEKYLEFIKHFSKQKNISVLNFKTLYKYEFNPAIYDKSIHKDLETIYSKWNTDELRELYNILPVKFKLKEFNLGIDILERYL